MDNQTEQVTNWIHNSPKLLTLLEQVLPLAHEMLQKQKDYFDAWQTASDQAIEFLNDLDEHPNDIFLKQGHKTVMVDHFSQLLVVIQSYYTYSSALSNCLQEITRQGIVPTSANFIERFSTEMTKMNQVLLQLCNMISKDPTVPTQFLDEPDYDDNNISLIYMLEKWHEAAENFLASKPYREVVICEAVQNVYRLLQTVKE